MQDMLKENYMFKMVSLAIASFITELAIPIHRHKKATWKAAFQFFSYFLLLTTL